METHSNHILKTNRTFTWLSPFMLLLILNACDNSTDSVNSTSDITESDWLIPVNQIVDGGPGKDGIPSLDNPSFIPASEADYIPDSRMVIGLKIGDEVRAYPHQIMDWHEIVNDEVDGKHIALNFCPLTGTGKAWNRVVNGKVTEFGVSGLLFRNNLIMYDRNTESNWSQMQLRSVNGDLSRQPAEVYTVVETTWEIWKEMYPESEVLSLDTGFSRDYSGFAYRSDFSTNDNSILFPIQNNDNRLDRKDRVLGVIDSEVADSDATVRAYPIDQFGEGINVIQDQLGTNNYVVVGSSSSNISAAFINNSQTEFTAVQNELPIVMEDADGNRYDIFGVITDGPNEGQRLESARSYTGYWYGWADFFPNISIHGN